VHNPFDLLIPIWDPFVDAMIAAILWIHGEIDRTGAPGVSGLTIIAFTFVLRVLVIPLYMQQLRSTKAMQSLQPKIQELQRKHGKDREKLMQEQMKLYREHGVNPMAGCLPMLIQMPIWIGLYSALLKINQHPETYPQFQEAFLWIPNLALHDPIYILPILTVATQWVVTKMMMTPSADPQQQQMNQIMQFMPLMFGFFALTVPAGLVLYWVVSNVFTMVQQYFVMGWGGLKPSAIAPPAAGSQGGGPAGSGGGNGGSRSGGTAAANGAGRTADAAGSPPAAAAATAGSDGGIAGIRDDEVIATSVRGGIRTYTLKAEAGDADDATAGAGTRRRGRKRQR